MQSRQERAKAEYLAVVVGLCERFLLHPPLFTGGGLSLFSVDSLELLRRRGNVSVSTIHFLNVKRGDCSILECSSGRVTMIDICAGNVSDEELVESESGAKAKPHGNFGMCSKPTNPIRYLQSRGINSIWRFILTHPDMDHMDGIKQLFESLRVHHFWDCGIRRTKPDFPTLGQYREEDWDFYEKLIAREVDGTKVITPRAGDVGRYWNADNDDGNGKGDYLYIISPDEALIDKANQNGDINDASYVVVYRSSAGPVIFAGDSNDKTWDYILENHEDSVSNAAVLFAPHHGRKSDRDYAFLDVVAPRISFFGCAPSEHLAYSAWNNRNLLFFTNNQCGNVRIYPRGEAVEVFIENGTYANEYTEGKTYQEEGYWFLCEV